MRYAFDSTICVEEDVLSHSPEWLVALIYEALLTNLRRASEQARTGDVKGKSASLSRARSLVAELFSTLDTEKDGEVQVRLASLYSYFALEIMNIARSRNPAALRRLIAVLEERDEASPDAAEELSPRSPWSNREMAISAA